MQELESLTPDQLKEAYRQTNMELHQGFKILNELEADQKISVEQCDLMKKRFYIMHKTMTDNQAKEKMLHAHTKKITQDLQKKTIELEKNQQMQKNNELNLKALEEKLEAAKKDTAIVD